MPKLIRIAYLGFALLPVATLVAQDRPKPVTVRGLAFDALRNRPLPDALVTLVGGGRNTTTDSRGHFEFDSVSPGPHTFAMQHAALDSLGFSGLSTRTTVTNGREEIRITVPAFSTLWRAACGGAPPDDSGFVYGTVRDVATQQAVRGATVELAWTEIVMNRRKRVTERRWRTKAKSDSTGSYSICGVAPGQWLRVQATLDSSASGAVDLPPNELRVHRLDLRIAAPLHDSAQRPTLVGVVTDAAGNPLADVRILTDGAPDVHSDGGGHFLIPNLVPGTRQIEANALGRLPVTAIIDVYQRDTTHVALQVSSAIALDAMRVTARSGSRSLAAEFTERRRGNPGYSMDSTEIIRYPALSNALSKFPSMNVLRKQGSLTLGMPGNRGGQCAPEVRIDGSEAAFNHLIDLQPKEVAAIEVFQRATMIPPQFVQPKSVHDCGLILVWTKYGFRNR